MIFTTRRRILYLFTLITLLSNTTITPGFFSDTPEEAVEELEKKLDKFRAEAIKVKSKTFITTFDEQGQERTNISNIGNIIEGLVKENEQRAQTRLTRLKEAIIKAIKEKDEASRDPLEKAFLNDEVSEPLQKRFNGEKIALSDSEENDYQELLERVPTIVRIPDHKTELFKLPQLKVLLEHLERIVTFRVGKKTMGIKRDSKQQNLMEEFKEKVEEHGSKITSLPKYAELETQLSTTFDVLKKAQADIIGHLEKLGIPAKHFTSDDDDSMRENIQDLLKQTSKINSQVKKVKQSGRWFKSKETWKNILTQAKTFNEQPWRSALKSPLFESDSSRDPALVKEKKGSYSYLGLDFVFEPGTSKKGLAGTMTRMNKQIDEILQKLEEQRGAFLNLSDDKVYMNETVTEDIRGEMEEMPAALSKNLAERRLTSAAQRTYWGYWWSRVMSYHNMFYSSGIRTVYFRLIAHEALKALNAIAPLADRGKGHSRADRYLQVSQGKDPKSPEVYNAIAEVGTKVRKDVLTHYNIQMNNILEQFDYLNQAPEYQAFVKQARLVLNTIDRTAESPFFRHKDVKKGRWLQYNGLRFDGEPAQKGDPEHQLKERGKTTLQHLFPHADTVKTSEKNELHSNVFDERMSDYSATDEIATARQNDHLSEENITATLGASRAYNAGYVAGTADRDDNRRRPADYERVAEETYAEKADQTAYKEGYLDGWSGARRSKYGIRRFRQRGVDKKMQSRERSRDEEGAYEQGYAAAEGDRTENLRRPANYERDARDKYRNREDLQAAYVDGYLDGWAEERRSAKGNKKERHERGRTAMGQRSYHVDEHDSHKDNTQRRVRGSMKAAGLLGHSLNNHRESQHDAAYTSAATMFEDAERSAERDAQREYENQHDAAYTSAASIFEDAERDTEREERKRAANREYEERAGEWIKTGSGWRTRDEVNKEKRELTAQRYNRLSEFDKPGSTHHRRRYLDQVDRRLSRGDTDYDQMNRSMDTAERDLERDAARRIQRNYQTVEGRRIANKWSTLADDEQQRLDRRKSNWTTVQDGIRAKGRNELLSRREREQETQRRWQSASHDARTAQQQSIETTRLAPRQLPPPPQHTPSQTQRRWQNAANRVRNSRFTHGPSQPEFNQRVGSSAEWHGRVAERNSAYTRSYSDDWGQPKNTTPFTKGAWGSGGDQYRSLRTAAPNRGHP